MPHLYDSNTLNVISANLLMSFQYANNDGASSFVKIANDLSSNLLILQECNSGMTNQIRTRLMKNGSYWYSNHQPENYDLAVISRFPIISYYRYNWTNVCTLDTGKIKTAVYCVHLNPNDYAPYLPRGYGGNVNTGKYSQYGWNKLPSGPVTNIQDIREVNQNSDRISTIKWIISDAKKWEKNGYAIVIAGDFNEPSTFDWTPGTSHNFDRNGVSYNWDTTAELANAGYTDVYRNVHPNVSANPGITWPSEMRNMDLNTLGSAKDFDARDRIDFVFLKNNGKLNIQSSRIIGTRKSLNGMVQEDDPSTEDIVDVGDLWGSDHKGLISSFKIDG